MLAIFIMTMGKPCKLLRNFFKISFSILYQSWGKRLKFPAACSRIWVTIAKKHIVTKIGWRNKSFLASSCVFWQFVALNLRAFLFPPPLWQPSFSAGPWVNLMVGGGDPFGACSDAQCPNIPQALHHNFSLRSTHSAGQSFFFFFKLRFFLELVSHAVINETVFG